MTQEQADLIMRAAEDEGLDVSLHPAYSGRFMFGRTTFAVSGNRGDVQDAVALAGIRPSTLKQDSLGLGIILY